MSTLINLPCKDGNATCRLSGDQKGDRAPSVPATFRASTLSIGRSHNEGGDPAGSWPMNASMRPSGDSASIVRNAGFATGGAGTSNRITCAGGSAGLNQVASAHAATITAPVAATAAG